MVRYVAVALGALVVASAGGAARAVCPPFVIWQHHRFLLVRTDGLVPRHPYAVPVPPRYGRVIARTRALDFQCVPLPGWRPRPVKVYALPEISPSVAVRIEGADLPVGHLRPQRMEGQTRYTAMANDASTVTRGRTPLACASVRDSHPTQERHSAGSAMCDG
jgi:hypothetical protein